MFPGHTAYLEPLMSCDSMQSVVFWMVDITLFTSSGAMGVRT